MNLPDLIDTLDTAADTDAPTGARAAKKLADDLAERLNELSDWAGELSDLLDEVEAAAGELTDADRADREDAHTGWVESIAGLLYHLRGAVKVEQPTGT